MSGADETSRPDVRSFWVRAALVALAPVAAAIGLSFGAARATSSVIDLGPNDARFVAGFRDVERDGPAYVRWSRVPESRVDWPVPVCGGGIVSLRVRRHFTDPVEIAIEINGRVAGRSSVSAGGPTAFSVLSFPFTSDTCESNAQVTVRTHTPDARGLGTTIDWVRISSGGGPLFRVPGDVQARWAVAAAAISIALAFLGVGVRALATAIVLWLVMGWTFSWLDPVSAERVGRALLPAALPAGLVAIGVRRFPATDGWTGRALAIALVGAGTLLPFLAQTAFYPDYWVHGLVTRHLASAGLRDFLEGLFAIQYERSLGLQEVDGRWYPFPYPPGFYLLPSLYNLYLGLSSVEAVVAAGIAAVALLSLATCLLARILGASEATALVAGAAVAIAPLVSRRQALGYFPGLLGMAVDTLVFAGLCAFAARSRGPGTSLAMILTLIAGFLVYTQSLLSFGLVGLAALVAALAGLGDRARMARVAVVLAAAAGIAFAAFYARYLPVFAAIEDRRSLPEESILTRLNALRSSQLLPGHLGEEPNDPYAGPGLSGARASLKVLHRTELFFGPAGAFFWIGLAGLWGLARGLPAEQRTLVVAWCLTFPVVTLLASGLPGPNGFRHLKDLEAITPLIAIGLATLSGEASRGRRAVGWIVLGLWCGLGLATRAREFADRVSIGLR